MSTALALGSAHPCLNPSGEVCEDRRMPSLFDSHAHFDSFAEDEAADVVVRARAAGVGRILAVGGWDSANGRAVDVARRHPESVAAAIGLDRDQAAGIVGDGRLETVIERLREQLMDAGVGPIVEEARQSLALHRCGKVPGNSPMEAETPSRRSGVPFVRAIGETGLDFHYSPDTADAQQALMRAQLSLAAELALPVVVHSRDAEAHTLEILGEHARRWSGPSDRIGVLHCFTGSEPFAKALVELGYHVSFSGIVTFKNAGDLRDVARGIPDDRLLIETDTPYLAPVPYRGKRNEPAYLVHVAEMLAELRGCPVEELAALTTANASALFGLGE